MAFREIHVVLVYEVIRRWQAGEAVRAVAVAVGVDRKTVRRTIEAAPVTLPPDGGPLG